MRRTFDALEVNELLDEGEDAAALLADRRNICLIADDGGAMFAWRGPNIYEGHTFFRCRGRDAIRLGRDVLREIETRGARLVWGITPEGLRHVRWFNRQVGFVSHGMIETPEGAGELFVMEFDQCQ